MLGEAVMTRWLRISLMTAFAFLGAGLWGFIAIALDAPTMVVSVGAVVIGAVVFSQAFKGDSN
jgi:hypothetical protein